MSKNLKQPKSSRRSSASGRGGYNATSHAAAVERINQRKSNRQVLRKSLAIIILLAAITGSGYWYSHHKTSVSKINVAQLAGSKVPNSKPAAKAIAPAANPAPSVCASNTIAQLALVSISQRRMWACQGDTQVYTSSVITGMENLPADLTPTGTYTIYAKETNLYLNGSDSTGSWHDYVYYWMPFLHNQYGSYGFHDATWRTADDFGNISPYSDDASHGCVEMPLSAAAWLYGWAQVGTTVTIDS